VQHDKLYKFLGSKINQSVMINFEGKELEVPSGISVASALLASGINIFRETDISGNKRSPYCMMGVCFECLLEIDGIQALQGCMIGVRNGMVIKRQIGSNNIKNTEIENF
jgi:predicted molibdopterin-dependent oxidoreductase YjgC